MKAITEHIYERGKRGTKYLRLRIPADLRLAYPTKQTHITLSLNTSDLREAKRRAHVELARLQAEFDQARGKIDLSQASKSVKRISRLSDDQLKCVSQSWMRQVLLADEKQRQEGLDDDEFADLSEKLTSQREELGRWLAQGKALSAFPALHGFLFLCGLDFDPDQEEAKRASYTFLRTIVETLNHQLARHGGNPLDTDAVAPEVPHPLQLIAPERAPNRQDAPTWDTVFETWRDYVEDRPKSTAISSQTPWRELHDLMQMKGRGASPAEVTPQDMTEFVQTMRDRGLKAVTINERLSKTKAIFKISVGKHILPSNPAADTLGVKENSVKKRIKRRLPFDVSDLNAIFGSEIFTQHKRSRGQSGEGSYWIPLIMFYTGARPEEVAGLAVNDLHQDAKLGWYFSIIDRPSDEDNDLFDDVPSSHRRTLKNAQSIRRIPIAQQLIELGLLGYVDSLREQRATVLFPELKKDWHGKLSGSYGKFFGRYKKVVGIDDARKVLYSFRHSMKDMMEAAGIPSKYLQRILGHTTGDGVVTDGYGSDLPFELIVEHFRKIEFPAVPALPWQPGRGSISLKDDRANASGV